jgi:hypothetical protein
MVIAYVDRLGRPNSLGCRVECHRVPQSFEHVNECVLQSHEALISTVVVEAGNLLIHHLPGIVTDLALCIIQHCRVMI